MSLETTIASGEIIAPRRDKYLFEAAVSEAISKYKERMYNFVQASPHTRGALGAIPKATGELRESVHEVLGMSKIVGSQFEVYWGFGAEHATFANFGRPPSFKMPPLGAIQAWCISKGIDKKYAFPIAEKIAADGYKGFHFWNPTKAHALIVLQQELQKALLKYELIATVTKIT